MTEDEALDALAAIIGEELEVYRPEEVYRPDDPDWRAGKAVAEHLREHLDVTRALGIGTAEPLGMRPDGSADPRIEAGMNALVGLGVPRSAAWDMSDRVLRAALEPGVTE